MVTSKAGHVLAGAQRHYGAEAALQRLLQRERVRASCHHFRALPLRHGVFPPLMSFSGKHHAAVLYCTETKKNIIAVSTDRHVIAMLT